jgi:hypothetical protein
VLFRSDQVGRITRDEVISERVNGR